MVSSASCPSPRKVRVREGREWELATGLACRLRYIQNFH